MHASDIPIFGSGYVMTTAKTHRIGIFESDSRITYHYKTYYSLCHDGIPGFGWKAGILAPQLGGF